MRPIKNFIEKIKPGKEKRPSSKKARSDKEGNYLDKGAETRQLNAEKEAKKEKAKQREQKEATEGRERSEGKSGVTEIEGPARPGDSRMSPSSEQKLPKV